MANPYENLDKKNYWASAVGRSNNIYTGIYTPKYEIKKTDLIMTAGSCFAQHIGRHLVNSGFNVMDYERRDDYLMSESDGGSFGYGIYSARYGNIYTIKQFLQLIKEALGLWTPSRDDVVWERDGRYYDAFRPAIEPNGFYSEDELMRSRRFHLESVKRLISDATIFIFTLGLTEAWQSNSGVVYPSAPGVVAGDYSQGGIEFINFDTPEMISQFEEVVDLLKKVKKNDFKFLLTVSPVPLTATAENRHVMVSTILSKSRLRVVADHFERRFSFIDYFPSYEIVINPWSEALAFDDNKRSVKNSAVENVMSIFKASHNISDESHLSVNVLDNSNNLDPIDIVCEDYLIETANLVHIQSGETL